MLFRYRLRTAWPGHFARWLGLLLLLSVAISRAETVYVVKRNDTLTGIARRYDVSVSTLARLNRIPATTHVKIGQRLKIPETRSKRVAVSPETYVVQRHDTLSGIAREFGVSVADLVRQNDLRSRNRIQIGQQLRIPDHVGGGRVETSALSDGVRAAIDRVSVKSGRWKYIVLHHSGTATGSVEGMDIYHRKQRHMENGLAYHFVIGNGRGMGDGEVAVCNRWKRQLQGGHLASERLNQVAIGICLVGNFDQKAPTARQLKSLEALVDHLRRRCKLPRSAVQTHQEINPIHTRCPGRRLASSTALKTLQGH